MENDPNENFINSSSINNESSYIYSLNNINQDSNFNYQQNLIDAFHNLREEDEDFFNDQDFNNDNDNDNDNDTNTNRNNTNLSNSNNEHDTSTVNSNDICLETSFEYISNNIKKDSLKISKDEPPFRRFIEHKRIPSAPLRLLNEFEEFKYSSQYINLEKAYLYANKLILIKSEGRFDIESDDGNNICRKLLKQVEALIHVSII